MRTSAERRRRIVLDVARDLFRTQGFHSTGIAGISKASGIHVAQIYRDFSSKEAIVAAIAEEEVETSFEQAAMAAEIATEPDGLRAWVDASLKRAMMPDHICLFTEAVAEASRNPAIAAVLQEIDARVRQHLTIAFARYAPPTRSPASVEIAVDLFIALTSGLKLRLIGHPDLDRKAMVGKIADIIEAELSGRGHGKPNDTPASR